jgi:hypothetical protein
MDTLTQYQSVIAACREIYLKKASDYGTSWRLLRSISIVDQIYIKAWRIRQIQELGNQEIEDSIENEFKGIVNYALIALIQLASPDQESNELSPGEAAEKYDEQVAAVRELMLRKNHDYGEAWRNMSQESFVDLILTKLLRIKQILANDGKTLISEGMDANFIDIINYAVFALIKIQEKE